MTVTLDVAHSQTDGDVAVLHGVDSEAALAHLCRSLITGSVFDTYDALVIDVGDTDTDTDTAGSLAGDVRRAAEACLHRHQWLAIVHSSADVAGAVAQARQWHRLVEHERALDVARQIQGLWSLVLGATGSVWSWVRPGGCSNG